MRQYAALFIAWFAVAPIAEAQTSALRSAELLSIGENWEFELRVDHERRQLVADDLVYWGAFREAPIASCLLLSDGGVLAGELVAVRQASVKWVTELWGIVEIPRNITRGILFRVPPDLAGRDRLMRRMEQQDGLHDLLLLENGDQLKGTVAAMERVDQAAELRFQPSRSRLPIDIVLSRITALTFAGGSDQRAGSERFVEIGWNDGSRLKVERFRQVDQDEVEAVTRGGAQLRARREQLWKAVKWIQPIGFGRVRFLSDLDADSFRQIPFFDVQRAWYRDRNVLGGDLRAGGVRYSKGLGMTPASRVTFTLPAQSVRFAAELALDDRSGVRGSVLFRVFAGHGDAAVGVRWEMLYESPIVRGGASPLPMSVELSGANQLALMVDFADRGDECDYANWLNARLLVE